MKTYTETIKVSTYYTCLPYATHIVNLLRGATHFFELCDENFDVSYCDKYDIYNKKYI